MNVAGCSSRRDPLPPPIPAFFHQPQTIEDLVNATVGRMLARIGIENELFQTWGD